MIRSSTTYVCRTMLLSGTLNAICDPPANQVPIQFGVGSFGVNFEVTAVPGPWPSHRLEFADRPCSIGAPPIWAT